MNNIPYNQEAEQTVLGSVFLEPELMRTLFDTLDEKEFYEERHRLIYRVMRRLHDQGEKIDYMTVSNELNIMGQAKASGGLDYLSALAEFVPSTANVNAYVTIVKDLALKRAVIDAAKEIADAGYQGELDSTKYVDFAEEKIFTVSQKRRVSEFSSISTVVDEVQKKIEFNMENRGQRVGLTTGFYRLDNVTQGLQNGELIILAARPGMGKSALAINIAVNAAKSNKDGNAVVALFSLEMGADQIVSRMISSEANVEASKIKGAKMDSRDLRFFELGARTLSKLNIYFDDSSSVTVSEIRAKCRKLYQDKGLDLVVIDYIQLIKGDNDRNNRQEEVSKISRSLKQLARELKIPVLGLAQLSRDVEKRGGDKRPLLADLRESGSIEQDADIVMFIYRDEYYNKDKSERPGEAEIIIAKNRQGSIEDFNLLWEPQFSRFKNKAEDTIEE